MPEIKADEVTPANIVSNDTTSVSADTTSITATDSEKATKEIVPTSTSNEEEKSLWGIFILAFLGGFAALLTPCVFPMIPMTVSFFTKQSKTKAAGIRNAFIYGISIIVIYVGLGMIITALFGIIH